MNKHNSEIEHELWEMEAGLHSALCDIRSEVAPDESVQRALAAAAKLHESISSIPVDASDSHGGSQILSGTRVWNNYRFVTATAATLFISVAFSVVLFSRQSAWAQVVEAVTRHPWIRLTLQVPPGSADLVDGMPVSATIWFSGDRTTAAIKSTQQNAWVDITKNDQYELTKDAQQIVISKMNAVEREGNSYFLDSLALFEVKLGSPAIAVQSAKQTAMTEVVENGVAYQDFVFALQSTNRLHAQESLTVRVEKESKTPVQLRSRQAVFLIDYPESGPTDIYSLGISNEVPVADLRNLAQYFDARPQTGHDDYEAVEITVLAGYEGRWINEAARYRFDDRVAQSEVADLAQVMSLSHKVYFAGTDRPTGITHTTEWWLDEANKLDFTTQKWGEFNYPHDRCYSPFGSVHTYSSVQPSQLVGLEGMLELRGKRHSVWLDPNRDFVMRRYEYMKDDGSIAVTQIDELVRDSQGHWFSTRWRSGRVSERGGLLPAEVKRDDSFATTVHIARIQFK